MSCINYHKDGSFSHSEIYNRFKSEYSNSKYDNHCYFIDNWREYIKDKDIGIVVGMKPITNEKRETQWTYYITDEKKWNYSKIKYEL